MSVLVKNSTETIVGLAAAKAGPSGYSHNRARTFVLALLLSSLHMLGTASPSPPRQSMPGTSQKETKTLYDRLDLAVSLIAQKQLARAEAELGAVLRARPHDPNALNLLGVVRAQQRRRSEAEQLFLRAIKQSPSLVGAYVNLGQLYVEAGKKDRALWAFGQAVKLSPERSDINYNLALLYEERRDCSRALDHLEKTPPADRSVEQLYLMVKCYLNLGKAAEAVALTAPLKTPGAVSAEDAASIAAAFATFRLLDHALAILDAARRESPDSFAVLYNLGALYSQKNEPERAAEYYESALKAKPENLATLLALAKVWRVAGDLGKSLSFLARARRIAPESPTLLYDYGWTALNLDQFQEALSALEQLHHKDPREPSYLYTLAVARFYNNEDVEALRLLDRYIASKPNDARGHFVRGVVLYFTKQYAPAREALEQSVALSPSADGGFYLAQIADNNGQTDKAVEWFKRALELEPSHGVSRAGLGVAYLKLKNYEGARAELERAIELDPESLLAAYQLSLLYLRLGDKERAASMTRIADRLRTEQKHQDKVGLRLAETPK